MCTVTCYGDLNVVREEEADTESKIPTDREDTEEKYSIDDEESTQTKDNE